MSIEKAADNIELVSQLKQILASNKDKRIAVVGTTSTGKSTFLRDIPEARDMDDLVFPKLSNEERDYVNRTPWTPEIGRTMIRLAKEKIKIEPGKPVFGTVVLDADLIVYLHISDTLLAQRAESRGVVFEDAKNMQSQIKEEIEKSGIPFLEFQVG